MQLAAGGGPPQKGLQLNGSVIESNSITSPSNAVNPRPLLKGGQDGDPLSSTKYTHTTDANEIHVRSPTSLTSFELHNFQREPYENSLCRKDFGQAQEK
jgi:hypothetical protein